MRPRFVKEFETAMAGWVERFGTSDLLIPKDGLERDTAKRLQNL